MSEAMPSVGLLPEACAVEVDPFYRMLKQVIELMKAFDALADQYHLSEADRQEADDAFADLHGAMNGLSYQAVQGMIRAPAETPAAEAVS